MAMVRAHVLCCAGTGCTSSKSPEIMAEFERQLAAHGLADEVQIVKTGCFGLCAKGPIVVIYPEGAFYSHVSVGDVEEIVTEHLLKGRIVQRLLFTEDDEKSQQISNFTDTDFYRSQVRIALRNCGRINPENIDEYIARDGYSALGKVLTEMTPEDVIQTLLDSGAGHRRNLRLRPARPRRRRLPHRAQVAVCRQQRQRDQVCLL